MPVRIIITMKPHTTPIKWGSERHTPKFAPEVINIRLFGPGVTEVTNAKAHSAIKISMFMMKSLPGGIVWRIAINAEIKDI